MVSDPHAMKVCNVHGCPNIHNNTGGRCPSCEAKADAKHWAKTRAYSSAGHRTFRTAVLTRDPICVICNLAQSTIADHWPMERTELIDAGLNPNDPARGRGLCKPCHDRWTAQSHPAGWHAQP